MASIKKRPDGRWRARFRDPTGKEHAKHFARRVDAKRWLDETTAAVVVGQFVDPAAGRMTLREYAEQWRAAQVHRPSTQAHHETTLRRHVYPILGDKRLSAILPSDVQAWVQRLTGNGLAPRTVVLAHSLLSSILRAAVRDRRIVANPCEGIKVPKAEKKRITVLTTGQVKALTEAMPAELRALITLAAGTGMRQGECLGLTADRIEFLHRTLTVDRQMLSLVGAPKLAPPKTPASVRTIPLPVVVRHALAAHLADYPPGPDGLVFTWCGAPISRSRLGHIWRKAVRDAGLPHGTGFHALRHYYASLLIRHGASVKVVQARLGHASASETLDTYSHLWPDSDDRTRDAIDSVLGAPADSLRTSEAAT
jgi:integrase